MPAGTWGDGMTGDTPRNFDIMLENFHLGPVRPNWEEHDVVAEILSPFRGSGRGHGGGRSDEHLGGHFAGSEQILDLRDAGAIGCTSSDMLLEGSDPVTTEYRSPWGGSQHGSSTGSRPTPEDALASARGIPGSAAAPVGGDGAAPVDLDHVLQALLLHQGLIEDHGVVAGSDGSGDGGDVGGPLPAASRPPSNPSSLQQPRTLREMRRTGPLGELTPGAQATLLGGALYAYGGRVSGTPADGSAPTAAEDPLQPPSLWNSTAGGDSGASSHRTTVAATVGEAVAAAPGGGEFLGSSPRGNAIMNDSAQAPRDGAGSTAFSDLLQLSLDRILQFSYRDLRDERGNPGQRAMESNSSSRAAAGDTSGNNSWDHSFLSSERSADSSMVANAVRNPPSENPLFDGPNEATVLSSHQEATATDRSVSMDVTETMRAAQHELAEVQRVIAEEPRGEEVGSHQGAQVVPRLMANRPLRDLGLGRLAIDAQTHSDYRLRPGSISESEDDPDDEDVMSVIGFDSPRSENSLPRPASSQRHVPVGDPHQRRVDPGDPLDETASVWGLDEDASQSHDGSDTFASATRSDSLQQSARTVLGDTLTIEGGLDGGLANVLHRLALENLSLDESLTRSVRRVLQLGTVLTGQRLSDEEILALPKVRFDAAEQQSCSICLEQYQRGELLTALRCGHFFHVGCLAKWFQRSMQCPLCRSQCVS